MLTSESGMNRFLEKVAKGDSMWLKVLLTVLIAAIGFVGGLTFNHIMEPAHPVAAIQIQTMVKSFDAFAAESKAGMILHTQENAQAHKKIVEDNQAMGDRIVQHLDTVLEAVKKNGNH